MNCDSLPWRNCQEKSFHGKFFLQKCQVWITEEIGLSSKEIVVNGDNSLALDSISIVAMQERFIQNSSYGESTLDGSLKEPSKFCIHKNEVIRC